MRKPWSWYLQTKRDPFDPLEKEDPDVTLSTEEREIRAWDLSDKKKMDEVSYRYENQKNIFMFRKKNKMRRRKFMEEEKTFGAF